MKPSKIVLKRFPMGKLVVTSFPPGGTVWLVLLFLSAFISSSAQDVWGTTSGGNQGTGSLYHITDGGTEIIPFEGGGSNNSDYFDGHLNLYGLVKSSVTGNYYGITLSGGELGEGILFEFNPETGRTVSKVHFNFYSYTGRPMGNLIEYNGILYGTMNTLSSAIFSFNPDTDEFKSELFLPSSCRGLTPVNGKFYGMTRKGGVKWAGAIFEFDPQTLAYTVLYQFNHELTGRYPDGGLTHVNGKLYGLTTSGGKYGQGTLIEYDMASHAFSKKIDFKSNINGSTPVGSLTYYNGKLLGATTSGGLYNKGVIFQYDPVTGVLTKLVDISNDSQGRFLDVINGQLYGVTTNGGSGGDGTLFTFDPVSRSYNHFYEFASNMGSKPFGHLLFDNNRLIGMTQKDGFGNGGVIFSYDLATGFYSPDHSFNYFPNGKRPTCLVEVNGKFYGVAAEGGTFGHGAVFEYDPATSMFTPLHDFYCGTCGPNYYDVQEGALLAVGNTLYGVTWKNGNDYEGELFKLDLSTGVYSHLFDFNSTQTGTGVMGTLVSANGKIYGTTKYGGANGDGVLYEYDPVTSTVVIKNQLKNQLTGSDMRLSTLNNTVYAASHSGGSSGFGMLSTYDPVSNVFTTKYQFQNNGQGVNPTGAPVFQSENGYGVALVTSGNTSVIYKYNTQTQAYAPVYNLPQYSYSTGSYAIHDNRFYGITDYMSSIFEFNLQDGSYRQFPRVPISQAYDDRVNSVLVKRDYICSPSAVPNEVVQFNQGTRKDGDAISADRSEPQHSLYDADANDSPNGGVKFTSLGFGGSIIVAFDQPVCNNPGNDFRVFETSYSNPSFYDCPEQAEVFVSKDALTWSSVGLTSAAGCNTKLDTDFDIQSSGLNWIKYVKVVDVTNPTAKRKNKTTCADYGGAAFNSAADGFDLDAIETLYTPAPTLMARQSVSSVSREVDVDPAHSKAVLFPNPVPDRLTIDLSQEEEMVIVENEMVLEIVDIYGRVLQRTTDAMDENWVITQDASKLTSGLYFARVKSGGVRRHYKFLKN